MRNTRPKTKTIGFRSPAPHKGEDIVRGGITTGRSGQAVNYANKWRENYNPMRGLNMARAVSLLESAQRGDTALLQWTYCFIEQSNPTLSGLISRCEAPLANFDWQIKVKAVKPPGLTETKFQAAALKQKATLEDAYNAIDNLREALLHLHLADFRGYAHLQKHRNADGSVAHLEPLNQYCICRDGLFGDWFWNPDSLFTSAPALFLGEAFRIGGEQLPLDDFIMRECPRPINRLGLIHTIRMNLCEKDWDAFLEIYGLPSGVVEMPPNVPQGRESEFEAAAQRVAEGGSGAIPHMSKYYPNDTPRGTDPFTPRLKHLDEALILAGTGGKLTMLAERGSGNLAGKVHDRTFDEIANGRAKSIGECFQKNFDAEILNRKHPGEPCLVYFHFGSDRADDLKALCENILTLSQAGKETDTAWLAEKTGYQIIERPVPAASVPAPGRGEGGEEMMEDGGLQGTDPRSITDEPGAGNELTAIFAAMSADPEPSM
jgi:phage gp29-like protein